MAIPNYQTVMLPLLQLVNQRTELNLTNATKLLSDTFGLSESERRERLPSGKKTIIYDRVGWANTYLKKAGLLASPQRGILTITEKGKQILSHPPQSINVQFLRQFPEFLKFHNSSYKESKFESAIDTNEGTPEEILEKAYFQIKNQILTEIIEKIQSCSPVFFENLVVDTIVKMGYGGSYKDAGQAIGRSGDEGIDGIINEDRLGLDVIYLQAKRWTGNVSRPEIQKFAGALQGKRAKKGIFITTSDFTSEAHEFVKNLDVKIVLVSGKELAELMWEHNVGLDHAATYELKKIDIDYFSE